MRELKKHIKTVDVSLDLTTATDGSAAGNGVAAAAAAAAAADHVATNNTNNKLGDETATSASREETTTGTIHDEILPEGWLIASKEDIEECKTPRQVKAFRTFITRLNEYRQYLQKYGDGKCMGERRGKNTL
jgi:hypothetical protein